MVLEVGPVSYERGTPREWQQGATLSYPGREASRQFCDDDCFEGIKGEGFGCEGRLENFAVKIPGPQKS